MIENEGSGGSTSVRVVEGEKMKAKAVKTRR